MTDEFERFEVEEGQPETQPVTTAPTTGIAWGVIFLFIAVGIIVVFAVQNTASVPMRFLWWEGDFPLSIVILATAALSILIGELIGVVYRRRRRVRQAEKEELRRLRGE